MMMMMFLLSNFDVYKVLLSVFLIPQHKFPSGDFKDHNVFI